MPENSLNGKCDVKYDVADYNDVLRGSPAEDDTWYTRYGCSFSERADGSVVAKVIPKNVRKVCIREKEMKVDVDVHTTQINLCFDAQNVISYFTQSVYRYPFRSLPSTTL